MDQKFEHEMNTETSGKSSNQEAPRQEAPRQETYQEYNFREPEYYGTRQPNYRPYQQMPKKEHPVLKELGLFTAKAVIASVIAALALGTTTVAVTKLTGFDQAIERLGEERDESRGLPDFGDFRSFGGDHDSSQGRDRDENGSGADHSDQGQAESSGPKLGVTVTTVTDDMIEQGYPAGVMIAQITKGGDADKAGLKEGDIITAFDGTVIKSNSALSELVQESKAGKSVKVVYKRLDQGEYKAMETTVTFSEAEQQAQ